MFALTHCAPYLKIKQLKKKNTAYNATLKAGIDFLIGRCRALVCYINIAEVVKYHTYPTEVASLLSLLTYAVLKHMIKDGFIYQP